MFLAVQNFVAPETFGVFCVAILLFFHYSKVSHAHWAKNGPKIFIKFTLLIVGSLLVQEFVQSVYML